MATRTHRVVCVPSNQHLSSSCAGNELVIPTSQEIRTPAHQQIWSVKSFPLFLSSFRHQAKILSCCSAWLNRERAPAQCTEMFLDCWWFIKQQKVDCEMLSTSAPAPNAHSHTQAKEKAKPGINKDKKMFQLLLNIFSVKSKCCGKAANTGVLQKVS